MQIFARQCEYGRGEEGHSSCSSRDSSSFGDQQCGGKGAGPSKELRSLFPGDVQWSGYISDEEETVEADVEGADK